MKKVFVILLFALGALGIVIAIRAGLPKYSYMLPGFGMLLLADLYLWFSVRNIIRDIPLSVKILVTVLYWLPLAMIVVSIITGFFLPFQDWNVPFRTYITGIAGIAYVSKIFPVLFLAATDVMRVLYYLFLQIINRQRIGFKNIRRWRFATASGWVLGVAFFLMMTGGMIFGIYDFKVRNVEIALADLPESFDGMTIAQVSDIHLGSWPDRAEFQRAVEMTNALHADVLFVTGDIANFWAEDVLGYEDILKQLKAPAGIFAIMGNHDYGDYLHWKDSASKAADLSELYRLYERLGWKLLLNDHAILKRGNDSIAIVGVENWGSYKRFQRRADLGKAVKGIENISVQLLLSHDPSYWDGHIFKKHPEIDVTFSGHTHGFQFGIETGRILWSPMQRMYREWAGLYEKMTDAGKPQYIYVNRGLGTIGFPGRVGILPEITKFTLKKLR